jgi:hypothetical protein
VVIQIDFNVYHQLPLTPLHRFCHYLIQQYDIQLLKEDKALKHAKMKCLSDGRVGYHDRLKNKNATYSPEASTNFE